MRAEVARPCYLCHATTPSTQSEPTPLQPSSPRPAAILACPGPATALLCGSQTRASGRTKIEFGCSAALAPQPKTSHRSKKGPQITMVHLCSSSARTMCHAAPGSSSSAAVLLGTGTSPQISTKINSQISTKVNSQISTKANPQINAKANSQVSTSATAPRQTSSEQQHLHKSVHTAALRTYLPRQSLWLASDATPRGERKKGNAKPPLHHRAESNPKTSCRQKVQRQAIGAFQLSVAYSIRELHQLHRSQCLGRRHETMPG